MLVDDQVLQRGGACRGQGDSLRRHGGGVHPAAARNGGYFGILKLEDYTGSTELRLFGQQYIDFHNYGEPGTPIIVKGKYQRRFNSSELRFNITNIQLLENLKGKLLRGITLKLTSDQINDTFRSLLNEHIRSTDSDRGELRLRIYDGELNRAVTLNSGVRVPLNRKLVDMLESLDVEFVVNRN